MIQLKTQLYVRFPVDSLDGEGRLLERELVDGQDGGLPFWLELPRTDEEIFA